MGPRPVTTPVFTGTATGKHTELLLALRLTLLDTTLRAELTAENRGRAGAYLRTRPVLYGVATRRPYSVLREDGTLLLSYLPAPTPPNINVHAPTPVYSRLVEPGERYEDRFELAVPVEERHPYCPLEYPVDAQRATAARVLFVSEACTADSVGTPRPGPEADPTLVYVWGAVRDLLEIMVDARVPVLRRNDPGFYRF
jgi:hypothetical protein